MSINDKSYRGKQHRKRIPVHVIPGNIPRLKPFEIIPTDLNVVTRKKS